MWPWSLAVSGQISSTRQNCLVAVHLRKYPKIGKTAVTADPSPGAQWGRTVRKEPITQMDSTLDNRLHRLEAALTELQGSVKELERQVLGAPRTDEIRPMASFPIAEFEARNDALSHPPIIPRPIGGVRTFPGMVQSSDVAPGNGPSTANSEAGSAATGSRAHA